MGWKPRCQAGSSSSSREFKYPEEYDEESSSQLEINVISGQNIKRQKYVAQMFAYAVAWIREDYKLKTHVVSCDDLHPCWNARLHFLVSDALLNQDKGIQSALTIELYCQGRLHDTLLGTARVLLSTLSKRGKGYEGAQSLALQVRRPSGCPQGILNIGSIIRDLDSACKQIPPSLTNPHLLYDEQQKFVKLPPLRELQEICRRSFSVSRDDVLATEKVPQTKFALDDNSLHQHPSFAFMEAVSEDENEENDELAMDAIYRKLKGLTKGKFVNDHADAENKRAVQMSTKLMESVNLIERTDSKTGDKISSPGFHDELSSKCNNGDQLQSYQISSKTRLPELLSAARLNESNKAAIESSEEHAEKHHDKVEQVTVTLLNHEAKCTEHSGCPGKYEDGLMAAKKQDLSAKKQNLSCNNEAVKGDKLVESVALVWKDLPLRRKGFACDEIVAGKNSVHCKSSQLMKAIWGRRANWSLWKGAAKIHLSPSDK